MRLEPLKITLILLPLAVACGGAGSASSPADLSRYEGPIGSSDTGAGEAAWAKACAACHDPDDGGEDVFGIGWSAAKVRHQVREGDDEMPPIPEKRLSAAELESLLAFLVTKGTVTPDAPAAAAEPNATTTP